MNPEVSLRWILAGLLLAGPAAAATLKVPEDHKSIQEAVLAASPGDVVLVAPGTYSELIQMRNGITLRAEQGPDSTILKDPGLAETAVDARVIECLEGIDRSTVIEGFALQSGMMRGAAIFCDGASPTIRGNVIRDFGWGINLRSSTALVEANDIRGCTPFGISIFASSPEIRGNTIAENGPNGIIISGRKSKPVIGGKREHANRIFGNNVAIINDSRNDIDATWNDWGWTVGAEMEKQGYPSDISAILDGNDARGPRQTNGKVDYRHWLRPQE